MVARLPMLDVRLSRRTLRTPHPGAAEVLDRNGPASLLVMFRLRILYIECSWPVGRTSIMGHRIVGGRSLGGR